jgi:hypothetical protein
MHTEQKNKVEEILYPCLQGTEIFSLPQISPYVIELRQLISAPNDIYKELYLPTLYNFMEFCQSMPTELENAIPYSLLTMRLELAIAVLKLRRGHMLPQHSNSETVAEEESVWTYALFTASLLTNIHYIQSDRSIELYEDKNTKLGLWHAIIGNLYEPGMHYRILAKTPPLEISATALQTELLGKIIPHLGMRWLSSHTELLTLWLEAITKKTATKNILIQLIEEAGKKINFQFLQKVTAMEKLKSSPISQSVPHNLLPPLMDWIGQQGNSKTSFFRLQEGLFITLPALSTYIEKFSIDLSLNSFLQEIEHSLLKKEENAVFKYCSVHFENREIWEGVIVGSEYLNDTLQSYPIRTDFIPNISLQEEA